MRAPRRAGYALAAAVATAALGVAGCGIAGERSARFEPDEDVPYGLLDSTTTTSPGNVGPRPATAEICLVDEGRLVQARRALPAAATHADLLAVLADGPTEAEARLGVSTAVPEGGFGDGPDASGGVVTVDLAPAFTDVEGRRQLLAVAQVVCTLTTRPGVGQVAFTLGGEPVEVPRGDGSATSEPVSQDDYPRLVTA